MQTFLPYPDFRQSARVLDNKRLGQQRREALFILQHHLDGWFQRWRNHPAILMWKGYERALIEYGQICCIVWRSRGFKDTRWEMFEAFKARVPDEIIMPPWIGNNFFHRTHQSNLVRKLPEHYRKFWPDIIDTLPYYWPVRKEE